MGYLRLSTKVWTRSAMFTSHIFLSENPRTLMRVGRKLQKTSSKLRKTRLFHAFYLLVLPCYTVIGALIFKGLDGEHDDRVLKEYEARCQENRTLLLDKVEKLCLSDGKKCFEEMQDLLNDIETCYRVWHATNRTMTHSMNDYKNALVYAFSVYTTIGYGNMAADTNECRLATVIYGAFGIPLFFAFVKEEGNLFRNIFISMCRRLGKWRKGSKKNKKSWEEMQVVGSGRDSLDGDGLMSIVRDGATTPEIFITDANRKRARFSRKQSSGSLFGFGDVFPKDSTSLLINAPLIVMGVVLFSMCYFILQEEIRNKAFEASRRARISISKYSHTIMQHASNHQLPMQSLEIFLILALFLAVYIAICHPLFVGTCILALFLYFRTIYEDETFCESHSSGSPNESQLPRTKSQGILRAQEQYLANLANDDSVRDKFSRFAVTEQVPTLTRYYESLINFFSQ
ncbi:unnamed protein product [Caenorhabditis auriculariae]|uniref:Potassium channel domain-containing protein n=1 Tax=Caenorhabditis auriculariae TaxID=2777116 RepID=A0A8S1GPM3_9PELO|nr:unnamed protein product [Caenorhabditis auriculariae]